MYQPTLRQALPIGPSCGRSTGQSAWRSLALGAVLVLAGCETAATDKVSLCTPHWLVKTPESTSSKSGGTAVFQAGALQLRAVALAQGPGYAVEVYQANNLTGDFVVEVQFKDFVAGGSGAYLQAGIQLPTGPKGVFAAAGIGTLPEVGISSYVQAPQPAAAVSQITPTAATAGTFRFARSGTDVTVRVEAGGQVAESTAAIGNEPAVLRIGLGNNHPTASVDGPTSVLLDGVTVQGGGGQWVADDFACDSLYDMTQK